MGPEGDLEAGESCKTLAELMGDDVSVVAEGSTGKMLRRSGMTEASMGEEVVHERGASVWACMAMVLDDCAKADVRGRVVGRSRVRRRG